MALGLVFGVGSRAFAQASGDHHNVEALPSAQDQIDPLILRLDALGVNDHPAVGSAGGGDESGADPDGDGEARLHRSADVELHLVSAPEGYGLLVTRSFEGRLGAERGLCRTPCTTWIDPGTYHLVVENRRGRDRQVPGLTTFMSDGDLELHIESRRLTRVAWFSTSLALVAGGLTLFFAERHPVANDDISCITSCFHYTSSQRTLMTVGGLITMFGGITLRYGFGARDFGRVVFHPRRLRVSPVVGALSSLR